MLFNIAPSNAERVKKEFTATRPEHAHGYFKSVILTSENRFYTYRIDMICGYYILTVRTRNKEQLEIIATFEEYKPGSIAATKGELYKNGSGYPYRTERSERYLKKYDQLACIVHGAIAAGLLFDMLEDEPTPAPLPEESMPATEANQDTTTGAQDGPTAPESNTAGENTTGANKAQEEATQRPKRRMAYIVECRKPRGDWKRYSDEQPTHEAAEKIKEEAETRHALTTDGAPIFYRIVHIDKGPEQIMTPQDGPTTAGTVPGEQDNTGSDTTPPRAQEANQEPGQAADHITGPTTGNTSGAAAEAITGRTTTPPQNPGHACENAPGRTERAQAEQVHTPHAKRPPRAPQRATTHGRPRGHPEKTANFG